MKVGLISDIHEDITGLRKALSILEKFDCSQIICLGDIIGFEKGYYGFEETRNADECIKLVRENCSIVVAGNHDLYGIEKIPENKAGFDYPYNWFDKSADERKSLTRNLVWNYEGEMNPNLSEDSSNYLDSLPEVVFEPFDEIITMFSHFIYPDPAGTTNRHPSTSFNMRHHFGLMKNNNCKLSFCGHGHFEAALYATKLNLKVLGFGTHSISERISCISLPCIAGGQRKTGVSILNFNNRELEIICLDN